MLLSARGLVGKVLITTVLFTMAVACHAATCTSQAELSGQDRTSLSASASQLLADVFAQDESALQSALLPSEASAWDSIRAAVRDAAPLLKGGQAQLRSVYLLETATTAGPADTQFFCSSASGGLTVTITLRALPPGRYGLVLADAPGTPQAAQVGLILAWDNGTGGWKLAGLFIRQGAFDGHDGIWYWAHGRELAKSDPWTAWYCYEAARFLLLPVDFISSPNLEKLLQEQSQIQGSPQSDFPLSLSSGDRTWKVEAVTLDPTLHEPDLGVVYESTGVTDPAAVRTEAVSVLSAFLKARPGLRANFHGLWAYAVRDGKRAPVMELPMAQIP
jgi:hypothetical protein